VQEPIEGADLQSLLHRKQVGVRPQGRCHMHPPQ